MIALYGIQLDKLYQNMIQVGLAINGYEQFVRLARTDGPTS